jgi:rSAM/selenodomain-associated transferase 2
MTVSVIVPTLNEVAVLQGTVVSALGAYEVVVADGGSDDGTPELALRSGCRLVAAPRGRGLQQNAGAHVARGDILLFLHADTRLPVGFAEAVARSIRVHDGIWGRFDLRFDAGGPFVRLIAHLISWRSWATGGATGDQAIFVRREVFESLGGFREPLLFEDVELCCRLKRLGRPVIPPEPVITSSRRWREDGAIRTTIMMWGLKLAYLAGVSSDRLARVYRDVR